MLIRTAKLATAVLVLVASTLLPTSAHRSDASPDPAQQFVTQLNAIRSAVGAVPLVPMPSLTADAQAWSAAMAGGACGVDRLCHRGDLLAVANRQAGGAWRLVGENVATLWGTDDVSVADVLRRFEASPEHKANDENPTFNEVGVGFATSADGLVYLTVEFLAADDPPPAPPSPQNDFPARPIPPRGVVVAHSPFRFS